MNGVPRSNLKLEEEVIILTIITPLGTSCLKVILFLRV
jgi:hypothetical protein